VTDSMCPEFPVLDAHKELFLGSGRPRERANDQEPVSNQIL